MKPLEAPLAVTCQSVLLLWAFLPTPRPEVCQAMMILFTLGSWCHPSPAWSRVLLVGWVGQAFFPTPSFLQYSEHPLCARCFPGSEQGTSDLLVKW